MIILGIDPGTTRIGYGVIEKNGRALLYRNGGILPISEKTPRLIQIEKTIKKLILSVQPSCIGVEKLFFTKNQKTAMSVAEARGVIMNAALHTGLPVYEFTPSEIKKSVTGNGSARKEAVAKMVRWMLHIQKDAPTLIDDVTDALAIAITASGAHAFHKRVR